jgi:hypothetical protein
VTSARCGTHNIEISIFGATCSLQWHLLHTSSYLRALVRVFFGVFKRTLRATYTPPHGGASSYILLCERTFASMIRLVGVWNTTWGCLVKEVPSSAALATMAGHRAYPAARDDVPAMIGIPDAIIKGYLEAAPAASREKDLIDLRSWQNTAWCIV